MGYTCSLHAAPPTLSRYGVAGDAIPATAGWKLDTSTSECTLVSGAEAFFSLQRGSALCPASYCTHTGLAEADAVVLYFLQDADGRVSLVVHADAPGAANTDGGASACPRVGNSAALLGGWRAREKK